MRFNYQVRTPTGEIHAGVVEASSREAALTLLQKQEFYVTYLEEVETQPFFLKKIKLFERIAKKDVVVFSRLLSLMFKSKIPLAESLQALAEQTRNSAFKEKILTIIQEVEAGTFLSNSLQHFPEIFSPFYISMVRSGEASGTLSESLSYLADHLEREYYLTSKIKGAMIYPALIVFVVIGVLILMMFFVIPNLAKVLQETGEELPSITKAIIAFSGFFRKWGWVMFLVLIGFLLLIFRYLKTQEGKKLFERISFGLPLISPFLKMVYLSRFAENLSTLISGGLPIAQALEITGEVVGSDIYKNIINEAKEEVRKGEMISRILSRYPKKFPPLLTQMVTVGERTGTLGPSLMNVVDFYKKEVERSIDNLMSILEPLLIIFLGLVVAGLMAAVLMPLYKLSSLF